ncbi:MAG: hypothetical protein Q9167_007573 [Letrouitia subvulpina]
MSGRGLDPHQAIIIYQNNDWVGGSCYVDDNGVWDSPKKFVFQLRRNRVSWQRGPPGNLKTGPGCVSVQESDTADQGTCVDVSTKLPDTNNTYQYSTGDQIDNADPSDIDTGYERRSLVRHGKGPFSLNVKEHNFSSTVSRIGRVMDLVYNRRHGESSSSTAGVNPSEVWTAYAQNAWVDARRRLQEALEGETQFKDEAKRKDDHKHDELR